MLTMLTADEQVPRSRHRRPLGPLATDSRSPEVKGEGNRRLLPVSCFDLFLVQKVPFLLHHRLTRLKLPAALANKPSLTSCPGQEAAPFPSWCRRPLALDSSRLFDGASGTCSNNARC